MSIHFVGNLLVGATYLAALGFFTQKYLRPHSNRYPLAITINAILLVPATFFIAQSFFSTSMSLGLEMVLLMMFALPPMALIYLTLKGHIDFMREDLEPVSKFDQLKEEFLKVASHELRTPLAVINGFGEILVREKLGPLNYEQKRRVNKILMQGQRLHAIIDEMLDLSRIRSGTIECRRDVFDLIPVLKAVIDDHQILAEQQGLQLIDKLPDLLPDVIGDVERTTQVVVNLISNAIKYTEVDGTIEISASVDAEENLVTISVTDDGIGIHPDDKDEIFREFFRAQQRHVKKYSGTGLGLTIVKRLVEVQGGCVNVHSAGLGKGSCFTFTIPMNDPTNTEVFSALKVAPLKA